MNTYIVFVHNNGGTTGKTPAEAFADQLRVFVLTNNRDHELGKIELAKMPVLLHVTCDAALEQDIRAMPAVRTISRDFAFDGMRPVGGPLAAEPPVRKAACG